MKEREGTSPSVHAGSGHQSAMQSVNSHQTPPPQPQGLGATASLTTYREWVGSKVDQWPRVPAHIRGIRPPCMGRGQVECQDQDRGQFP
ncbi:hypothetical protein MAR_015318 [Mya arenaria]|uniref:Uncharacterized protein n=1 Tax=Mya arenaria TaxID=6604 RepID=A0ABY7FJ41_MYAAR|nr:hypothetical protein MAR_015318 [Mya arenaria]